MWKRRYLWTPHRRKNFWWVGNVKSACWILSEKSIFEDTCTEEGTGAFKFSSYEARTKFNSTYSAVHRGEYWSASLSTQEHQKVEGKLKHMLK